MKVNSEMVRNHQHTYWNQSNCHVLEWVVFVKVFLDKGTYPYFVSWAKYFVSEYIILKSSSMFSIEGLTAKENHNSDLFYQIMF